MIAEGDGSKSQSAFMRGFIDDVATDLQTALDRESQSAFMRGFIDDMTDMLRRDRRAVSIRVHARLHR